MQTRYRTRDPLGRNGGDPEGRGYGYRQSRWILLLLAAAVFAQETPTTNSAISGVVRDAGTGTPLADYDVSTTVNATWVGNTIVQSSTSKSVHSVTDQQGRYRLGDLPPGSYRVTARNAQNFLASSVTRHLTVAGHDLENIDFKVVGDGTITGKVVDENKEPVPEMTIYLVTREYFLGAVGYHVRFTTKTDDRGIYKLGHVTAGTPFLIVADKRELRQPAYAETPLDPKLRRRVPMRTWYPNSPSKDGASPVTVRPGEVREGVDIAIRKSASYCIDGVLSGPLGPAALRFDLEALQPSSGSSSTGGMYMSAPGSVTAPDGKFRMCDLFPGGYRLTISDRGAGSNGPQTVVPIQIGDRDLHDLKITMMPGVSLDGEVAWDGAPPAQPVDKKVSLSLQPLFRAGGPKTVRADIPDTFTFENLVPDAYLIRPFINAPGLYIKDVTYSGRSVLYEPLHVGSAMAGSGLRVILGHDGATVSAQVSDKDGNPLSDMRVLVIPAEIASEAELADRIVKGQTNQMGTYRSQILRPGKYFVAASDSSFDATPESIAKIWRSRNRFQEVELPPSGSAQVTLKPVAIE